MTANDLDLRLSELRLGERGRNRDGSQWPRHRHRERQRHRTRTSLTARPSQPTAPEQDTR